MNEIHLMADNDKRQAWLSTAGPRNLRSTKKFWGSNGYESYQSEFGKTFNLAILSLGGPFNLKFEKIGVIACFERINLRTKKVFILFWGEKYYQVVL